MDAWGYSLALDLKECDPLIIKSREKIQDYVIQLCKLIDMTRHGDVLIDHFGEGNKAGYTMVQLIETSCITAHFANDTNSAYIDVFSCKPFDHALVEAFSANFFSARSSMAQSLVRE